MIGVRADYTTDLLPPVDFEQISSRVPNQFPWDLDALLSNPRFRSSEDRGTDPIVVSTNIRTTGAGERTVDSVGRRADLYSRLFEVSNGALAVILRSLKTSREHSSVPLWEQVRFKQRPKSHKRNWGGFFDKLRSYSSLVNGWDGYSAPAPLHTAVARVYSFLYALRHSSLRPTRVSPSVVGGIGVTFRKGQRKSYVEFYNNGSLHALFSDGESEPRTCRVQPTPAGYGHLIMEIRGIPECLTFPQLC